MGRPVSQHFTDLLLWDINPHHYSKRVGVVDPDGVANLYGLWDWVGMAPCMGPMSPVRAHSLWAVTFVQKG